MLIDRKKILILYQNQKNMVTYKEYLHITDAEVLFFEDPHKALSYISDSSVDLIISDLYTKEVTGLEFLQEIQRREMSIPFVLVGNDEGAELCQVAMEELECHDFIAQSCCQWEFLLRVNQAMKTFQKKHEYFINSIFKSKILNHFDSDLKIYLNSMIGIGESLDDIILNEEHRHYLSLIKKSGLNAIDLLDKVIITDHLLNGNIRVNNHEFNFHDVIESEVYKVKKKYDGSKVNFQYVIGKNVPMLMTSDSRHLATILNCLLDNAFKFTSQGTIEILTERIKDEKKNDMIVFIVRDTGKGLSYDLQKRIFKLFQQGYDNNPIHSGLGVGLYIVKGLCDLIEGQVELMGHEGVGTEVRFQVPWVWHHHEFIDEEDNRTLLIVEDEIEIASMLDDIVKDSPYEIIHACNGREALSILESRPIDLIISDIRMPEVDGIELFRKIEELGLKIPFAFLSAHVGGGELLRFLEYMKIPFFEKPLFQIEPILEFIKKSIEEGFKNRKVRAIHKSLREIGAKRILIVDDSKENRFLLKTYLEGHSFDLAYARNGKEAIEIYEKENFDLIVMDMQAPILDNHETTKHIREIEKSTGRKSLIAAMTDSHMFEEKDHCLKIGCDIHMARPIKKYQFLKKILTLFKVF